MLGPALRDSPVRPARREAGRGAGTEVGKAGGLGRGIHTVTPVPPDPHGGMFHQEQGPGFLLLPIAPQLFGQEIKVQGPDRTRGARGISRGISRTPMAKQPSQSPGVGALLGRRVGSLTATPCLPHSPLSLH